jgi:hypothetical protein
MARRLSEVVVVAMQRNDWKRTRSGQFEEETGGLHQDASTLIVSTKKHKRDDDHDNDDCWPTATDNGRTNSSTVLPVLAQVRGGFLPVEVVDPTKMIVPTRTTTDDDYDTGYATTIVVPSAPSSSAATTTTTQKMTTSTRSSMMVADDTIRNHQHHYHHQHGSGRLQEEHENHVLRVAAGSCSWPGAADEDFDHDGSSSTGAVAMDIDGQVEETATVDYCFYLEDQHLPPKKCSSRNNNNNNDHRPPAAAPPGNNHNSNSNNWAMIRRQSPTRESVRLAQQQVWGVLRKPNDEPAL